MTNLTDANLSGSKLSIYGAMILYKLNILGWRFECKNTIISPDVDLTNSRYQIPQEKKKQLIRRFNNPQDPIFFTSIDCDTNIAIEYVGKDIFQLYDLETLKGMYINNNKNTFISPLTRVQYSSYSSPTELVSGNLLTPAQFFSLNGILS